MLKSNRVEERFADEDDNLVKDFVKKVEQDHCPRSIGLPVNCRNGVSCAKDCGSHVFVTESYEWIGFCVDFDFFMFSLLKGILFTYI